MPVLTQSQSLVQWAPACKGPWARISLFGAGVVSVRPGIADATLALDACLKVWGYATRAADTGAYACRDKTGSSQTSKHALGIAIDINWKSNPYQHHSAHPTTDLPIAMVQAICGIRTNNGVQVWNWGGFWSGNQDTMHFEIVCAPGDLLTGINEATVPVFGVPSHPTPVDPANPTEDEVANWIISDGSQVWLEDGFGKRALGLDEDLYKDLVFLGHAHNSVQADGNVDVPTNPGYLAKLPARAA